MKIIHFLTAPGVKIESTYPIYRAFTDLLENLRIRDYFEIHDQGVWRELDYLDHGNLRPHMSVDWMLDIAYRERIYKDSLNLNTAYLISNLQRYAMTQKISYSVLITNKRTIHPKIGLTYGATARYYCSVFSLEFIRSNSEHDQESLYNLALHEFGHLFGLILDTSRPELKHSHCTEPSCVMAPYLVNKKLYGCASFCQTCLRELQEFVDHVKYAKKIQMV